MIADFLENCPLFDPKYLGLKSSNYRWARKLLRGESIQSMPNSRVLGCNQANSSEFRYEKTVILKNTNLASSDSIRKSFRAVNLLFFKRFLNQIQKFLLNPWVGKYVNFNRSIIRFIGLIWNQMGAFACQRDMLTNVFVQ